MADGIFAREFSQAQDGGKKHLFSHSKLRAVTARLFVLRPGTCEPDMTALRTRAQPFPSTQSD